jgi:hypothetical protein
MAMKIAGKKYLKISGMQIPARKFKSPSASLIV